jgi:hypothetical protein
VRACPCDLRRGADAGHDDVGGNVEGGRCEGEGLSMVSYSVVSMFYP